MYTERDQCLCQVKTKFEGQLIGRDSLWEMLECLQRLLKVGHCLTKCGAGLGPGAGLSAVVDGFVPHLALLSVMRQPFSLLTESVGIDLLKSLDYVSVYDPSVLLQKAAIGHLVRERMLEQVDEFREEPALIEELRCL
jgi:hypothetical protein